MLRPLFFFLVFILIGQISAAEDMPPMPDYIQLKRRVTLFSRPGFENWRACEKNPKVCIGWPDKGTNLQVLEQKRDLKTGKLYYRVAFRYDRADLQYWIYADVDQGKIDSDSAFYRIVTNGEPLPARFRLGLIGQDHTAPTPVEPISPPSVTQESPPEPEPSEDCPPSEIVGVSDNMIDAVHKNIVENTAIKPDHEIDSYMKCYVKGISHERWRYYESVIRPQMKTASQAFGVPLPLLKCLAFKESKLNPRAQNPDSGAFGLLQFLPNAASLVNSILSSAKRRNRSQDEQRFMDTYERIQNPPVNFKQEQMAQAQKDATFLRQVVLNHELADMWKNYFPRATRNKTSQPRGRPAPHSLGFPNNWRDTSTSIGTAALYIRYITEYMNWELMDAGLDPADIQMDQEQQMKFLVIVSAFYNIGHGASMDAVIKIKPPSIDGWYEKIKSLDATRTREKQEEVKNHMESIRRCMEKENWGGPTYIGGGEGPRCEAD